MEEIQIKLKVIADTQRALQQTDKDVNKLRADLELLAQKTTGTKGLGAAVVPRYAPATKEIEGFNRATSMALDNAIGKTKILENITNKYLTSLGKQKEPITSAQFDQAEKMMNSLAASNQRVISLQDKLQAEVTQTANKIEATDRAWAESWEKIVLQATRVYQREASKQEVESRKKADKLIADIERTRIAEEQSRKRFAASAQAYQKKQTAQHRAQALAQEKSSRDAADAILKQQLARERNSKQILEREQRQWKTSWERGVMWQVAQDKKEQDRRARPGGPRGFNPPWAQNTTIRAFQDLEARLSLLTARIAMFTFVFRTVFNTAVRIVDPFIEKASEAERSFLGLQQTAKAFGVDALKAKDAAFNLAKNGFLTAAEAAEGLKRLIGTGFGLEQSIKLMDGATNSAVFNAQAGKSVAEAVLDFTEALRTGRSQVLDNAGVIENLSQIMVQAGLSLNDFGKITESAEIRGKFFNRMMVILGRTMGNAELASKTFLGAQNRLRNSWINLLIIGGETITQNKRVLAVIDQISIKITEFTKTLTDNAPALRNFWGNFAEGALKTFNDVEKRLEEFKTGGIGKRFEILLQHPLEGLSFSFLTLLESQAIESEAAKRIKDSWDKYLVSLAILSPESKQFVVDEWSNIFNKIELSPEGKANIQKIFDFGFAGPKIDEDTLRKLRAGGLSGKKITEFAGITRGSLRQLNEIAITARISVNEMGKELKRLGVTDESLAAAMDNTNVGIGERAKLVRDLTLLLQELGFWQDKVADQQKEVKLQLPFAIVPETMEKFVADMVNATGTAMDQVKVEMESKWKEFRGTFKLDETVIRNAFKPLGDVWVERINELLKTPQGFDAAIAMMRAIVPETGEIAKAIDEAIAKVVKARDELNKLGASLTRTKITQPMAEYARTLEGMTAGPLRMAVLENQKLTVEMQEQMRLYPTLSKEVQAYYKAAMAKNLEEANDKLLQFKVSLMDTDDAGSKVLKGIMDLSKEYKELGTDGASALGDISALMEGKVKDLTGKDLTKDIEEHLKSMSKTSEDEYQKAAEASQVLIDKQAELDKSFQSIVNTVGLYNSVLMALTGFGLPGVSEAIDKLGKDVEESARRTKQAVGDIIEEPAKKGVENLEKLFRQSRDAMAQVTDTKAGRRANRFQDLIDQLDEARKGVDKLVIDGNQMFTVEQIDQMIGNLQRLGSEGVQKVAEAMRNLHDSVDDVTLSIEQAEQVGAAFGGTLKDVVKAPFKMAMGEKIDWKGMGKQFAESMLDAAIDPFVKKFQAMITEELLGGIAISANTTATIANTGAIAALTASMTGSTVSNIAGGAGGMAGGVGGGAIGGGAARSAGAGAAVGGGNVVMTQSQLAAREQAAWTGGAQSASTSALASGTAAISGVMLYLKALQRTTQGFAPFGMGASTGRIDDQRLEELRLRAGFGRTDPRIITEKDADRIERERRNRYLESKFGKYGPLSGIAARLSGYDKAYSHLFRPETTEELVELQKKTTLSDADLLRRFPSATMPTRQIEGFGNTSEQLSMKSFWKSFASGGIVGFGNEAIPIIAHRGEGILSHRGVAAAGGERAIDRMNQGMPPGNSYAINITVNGSADNDVSERIAEAVKRAIREESESGRRTVHDRGTVKVRR